MKEGRGVWVAHPVPSGSDFPAQGTAEVRESRSAGR